MWILAGILFVVCSSVCSLSAEKSGNDNVLHEILFRSSQPDTNDNTDTLKNELDFSDVTELLDGADIGDLMNFNDVVNMMNIDDLEKLRVAIHSKSHCRCHDNHCECCKTIYLFWKIPIFKACIGLYYEGQDFVMRLKVYGITLVKHKLPLSHQKPVCARVMGTYDLCAELYNVKIHNGVVHACLKITEPVTMDLKCFTLHSPHDSVEEGLEWAVEDASTDTDAGGEIEEPTN